MLQDKPITLEAALRDLRARRLVPTDLGSGALRRLAASVRRQALFAARLTHADVLKLLQRALAAMASNQANMADARLAMRQALALAGYDPETGFPGDAARGVPPAEPGSLQDLSGRRRLDLIIETNYRLAANRAYTEAGQTPSRRWQFPCWELVRIYWRRVPRGMRQSKDGLTDDPGKDWYSRWTEAGGTIYEDGQKRRMIATKDSPVWEALGDGAGGFDDTLGNPYPPFAFQSGYGVREVAREDAIRLGVIDATDTIAEQIPELDGLRVDPDSIPAPLKKAMADELETGRDGKLTLAQMVEREAYQAVDAYRARTEGGAQ